VEQKYITRWKQFLTEQEDGTNSISVNADVANYPKLIGNVIGIRHFAKAAGDEQNEQPGFFPEAAADVRKLKDMLTSQGWKKMNTVNVDYGNFNSWQQSIGFPWPTLNEYMTQYWNTNVVPNAIELSMSSPNDDASIYVSVWTSYDTWLESKEPGIEVRVCAGVQFKGCATSPLIFNRSQYKDSEQLAQQILYKIRKK